ncbi:protein kinase family protein [Actinomycetospora sp. C-140]
MLTRPVEHDQGRGCEVATESDAPFPDTPGTGIPTSDGAATVGPASGTQSEIPGAVDAATRGLDAVLGREVAMVTLPPVRGEDLVVRTEQVRRLAGLHHAHLVEVFDVDGLAEGAESTLVLQSVAGRPLDPAVDRAGWSPLALAEIGAQLASALAHAHARGVVHGGIGPASVVFGGTPGAPYAWLTGFTAALRPAPPTDPAVPDARPPHPGDDVADLGRALLTLLDHRVPGAPALDQELADMAAGRVAARTAAESLAHVAEALRHVDEDQTGIVPLVVPGGGADAAPDAVTTDAAGPAVSPPVPAPRAAAGAPAAGPAGAAGAAGTAVGDGGGRRSRRARRVGRSVPFAALGGAAIALAAASGFVLWATEDAGTPQEVGVSGLTTPERPAGPPVAVAPPAGSSSSTGSSDDTASSSDDGDDTPVRDTTTRSPITNDVTTRPGPTVAPVPPTVPPTVPTTAPTTAPTQPTQPTTGPTTDPTTGPTTTTTPRGAARNGATLAAP